MPAPPEAGDGNIWAYFWSALGGIFLTMGSGVAYLLGQISKSVDEGRQARERIWDQINTQGRADLIAALDIEKRFSTKDDIDRLEGRIMSHITDSLRKHEINVQRDIEMRIGRNTG